MNYDYHATFSRENAQKRMIRQRNEKVLEQLAIGTICISMFLILDIAAFVAGLYCFGDAISRIPELFFEDIDLLWNWLISLRVVLMITMTVTLVWNEKRKFLAASWMAWFSIGVRLILSIMELLVWVLVILHSVGENRMRAGTMILAGFNFTGFLALLLPVQRSIAKASYYQSELELFKAEIFFVSKIACILGADPNKTKPSPKKNNVKIFLRRFHTMKSTPYIDI